MPTSWSRLNATGTHILSINQYTTRWVQGRKRRENKKYIVEKYIETFVITLKKKTQVVNKTSKKKNRGNIQPDSRTRATQVILISTVL